MKLRENLKENIFKFFTGENYNDIRKVAQHIKDTKESMRPFADYLDSLGETRKGGNRIYRRNLYHLAEKSDTIQIIINALNGEILRNGVEVKEKFVMKCTNEECGKEFDMEPKERICDVCKSPLRNPLSQEKKRLEDKMEKMNENNQTLLEVLEEANTDVERIDDMYYLISYEYGYTDRGIALTKEFEEMVRINPLNVAMLADNMNRLGRDENGKKLYFCPEHRETLINETAAKFKVCPVCGRELFRAYYSIGGASGASQTKGTEKYYADHEIIHSSKYQPGLLEGKSNLISCENKVITLDQQDRYIRDCYLGRRSPNGLLLISTANYESFDKAWDARAEKAKANPNMLYPIVAENKDSDGKNKDWVQYIDLMRTPKEMEMIPLREEYRKNIGAMYRVMPIWMSDAGKGVGQEGLQIVVTNRGIMSGQRVINEKVLLKLSRAIGATDYYYELVPNEKRDEMSEVQLEAQKIQNAVNMSMMGFKIKMNEEKEFEYEDADPDTEVIDPEQPTQSPGLKPKTGIVGEVQDQRFEGELIHDHQSQNQQWEGETQDVHRAEGTMTTGTSGTYNPVHQLREFIKPQIEEVKKEFKLNFKVEKADLEGLSKFLKMSLFEKAFESLTKSQSEKIEQVMLSSVIDKISNRETSKKVKELIGDKLSEGEIDRIVRTERGAIKAKSREFSFRKADPEEKKKYKWLSIPDSRRTDTCFRISARTAKGVSLDKMKEIIKEESKKDFPDYESRDYHAHYLCRSVVVPI